MQPLTLEEFKEIDSCDEAMEKIRTSGLSIQEQHEYLKARWDYMFYVKYRPPLKYMKK